MSLMASSGTRRLAAGRARAVEAAGGGAASWSGPSGQIWSSRGLAAGSWPELGALSGRIWRKLQKGGRPAAAHFWRIWPRFTELAVGAAIYRSGMPRRGLQNCEMGGGGAEGGGGRDWRAAGGGRRAVGRRRRGGAGGLARERFQKTTTAGETS
jgi:hypothetical protein